MQRALHGVQEVESATLAQELSRQKERAEQRLAEEMLQRHSELGVKMNQRLKEHQGASKTSLTRRLERRRRLREKQGGELSS